MLYAAAIRTARQRAGMTQAEVAVRAGCGQGSLSRIEAGRQVPDVRLLDAIARGMGLSPLVLYLEAAENRDVPSRSSRRFIEAQIACLLEMLWRHRTQPRGG